MDLTRILHEGDQGSQAIQRDHTIDILRRMAVAFGADRAIIHALPDWDAVSVRLCLGDRSTAVGVANEEIDALLMDLRVRDRVHERLQGALDELRRRLGEELLVRGPAWSEMPERRRASAEEP